MRTRGGVPIAAIEDADAEALARDGLIWRRDGRVGLTPAGRLLANEVTRFLR